jgi:hypothetical protein
MTNSDDSDGPVDGGSPIAVADEPMTVSKPRAALRRQQKRALTIFAATFASVAIFVVVALFAAGRGGGVATRAALPGSKTSAAAASSGHPAPTSKLAPGPTPEDLAVSTHIPAKLRTPLRRWNNGNGGTALAAVSNEMGIALQAGGTKLYVSMKAACTALTVAIKSADVAPPIPDAALQNRYTAALAQLATAGTECRAAISERVDGDETVATYENQAVYHQAELRFSVGVKDLYGVTSELALASGN